MKKTREIKLWGLVCLFCGGILAAVACMGVGVWVIAGWIIGALA